MNQIDILNDKQISSFLKIILTILKNKDINNDQITNIDDFETLFDISAGFFLNSIELIFENNQYSKIFDLTNKIMLILSKRQIIKAQFMQNFLINDVDMYKIICSLNLVAFRMKIDMISFIIDISDNGFYISSILIENIDWDMFLDCDDLELMDKISNNDLFNIYG